MIIKLLTNYIDQIIIATIIGFIITQSIFINKEHYYEVKKS